MIKTGILLAGAGIFLFALGSLLGTLFYWQRQWLADQKALDFIEKTELEKQVQSANKNPEKTSLFKSTGHYH